MKNIGLAKALDGLGFEWSEEGDGMYVIKDTPYDIFLLAPVDRPGVYEMSIMAYLPEEYEGKRSFMEDVLDTVNNCGYPELRAELIKGDCILSKEVKYRGCQIKGADLKKELFLLMEAYNFFVMNVMLKVDMNNNPEDYGL